MTPAPAASEAASLFMKSSNPATFATATSVESPPRATSHVALRLVSILRCPNQPITSSHPASEISSSSATIPVKAQPSIR